jgi:hypothetical protein
VFGVKQNCDNLATRSFVCSNLAFFVSAPRRCAAKLTCDFDSPPKVVTTMGSWKIEIPLVGDRAISTGTAAFDAGGEARSWTATLPFSLR